MNLIFNPKKFFLDIKNQGVSTKYVWIYYIISTLIIGSSTISLTKIISDKLLQENIKVGQAFYFSLPILLTILIFIFLIFGIFVTAVVIHVVSRLLGCSKRFNKSFTAYMYINVIPSTQLIFTGVIYFITNKMIRYNIIVSFFIDAWVSVMIYLTFRYTLECKKQKAIFGTAIFTLLYIAKEVVRFLPSFLS